MPDPDKENRSLVPRPRRELSKGGDEPKSSVLGKRGLVNLWLGKGKASLEKGDYDQAIEEFGQAIHFDSECSEAWLWRGVAHFSKDDYDQAIKDYDEAIRLDPEFAVAYARRGVLWVRKGNYSQAISDYSEAIRLDRLDYMSLINRGHAHTQNGDYEQAVNDFSALIEGGKIPGPVSPNFQGSVLWFSRGYAHFLNYEYEEAIRNFSKVMRLCTQKDSAPAWHYRGLAHQEIGNLPYAESDLKMARSLGYDGS